MRLAGILILVCAFVVASAESKSRPWTTGRLVSTQLSGQGSTSAGKGSRIGNRSDIWWTCCISAGDKIYSATTRENPAKIGITPGNPVRIAIEKKLLYILESPNRIHILRIFRSGTGSKCP
jgi:hypothetical protein